MVLNEVLTSFDKRLVIIGFGSIGKGVLPLIFDRIKLNAEQIHIFTADASHAEIAHQYGVHFYEQPLDQANYKKLLTPLLEKGDFLLNLSVDVSSLALIELCSTQQAFYLDTCIEPWAGRYTDPALSVSERSNYGLREEVLHLRKRNRNGPTALIAHGANPGLVSHFLKQALLNIASDLNLEVKTPKTRQQWAELASQLNIKVVHVAERDTQESIIPKNRGEFVNTWSVDGFISESAQPAELGWGSHERELPPDGHHHGYGCNAAIYINRPGGSVRVRSWTPQEGTFHGFLIPHNEAISIADYFTINSEDGRALYRPTVHYAYHPCNDAVLSLHELAGKNWTPPTVKRLMMDEIKSGMDELGVILMGHEKGAYWYGSHLSTAAARKLAPHNNATSLQVCSAVLAGMIWILENPTKGIVEAEEIDFARIIEIAKPYLGDLEGYYTNWNPLENRQTLFREQIDLKDPWQFQNFLVI